VHHHAAQHHAATALPAVSMTDFKKQGGTLNGRGERYDAFEGEPRSVGRALGGSDTLQGAGTTNTNTTDSRGVAGNVGNTASHGTSRITGTTGTGTTGTTDSNTTNKPSLGQRLNPSVDADGDGKRGFMD
jgi:hypothetical protein